MHAVLARFSATQIDTAHEGNLRCSAGKENIGYIITAKRITPRLP